MVYPVPPQARNRGAREYMLGGSSCALEGLYGRRVAVREGPGRRRYGRGR